MKTKIKARYLSLFVSIALIITMTLTAFPMEAFASNGSLSGSSLTGYNFTFSDIYGNTKTFNGNDGKVDVIVFGQTSTCSNTQGALQNISKLIPNMDMSKVNIYSVSYGSTTADDVKSLISKYSFSDKITYCLNNENSNWSSIYSVGMQNVKNAGGATNVAPLVIYKSTSGSIYYYTTAWNELTAYKEGFTKGGITVNLDSDYTLTDYDITVTYGQTEARSMLTRINQLRTSSTESWYWKSDNTNKVGPSAMAGLTYDYDLEKVAMLRAAEIAYSYAHTRPNGNPFYTAYDGLFTYSTCGENIAYGFTSASAVETAWEEENEDYDGQGHRRNLLNSNFTAIGIGHVTYNGIEFWVQEFGNPVSNTTATKANDSKTTVTIQVIQGTSPENHGYSGGGSSTDENDCDTNGHNWVQQSSTVSQISESDTYARYRGSYHTVTTESICTKCGMLQYETVWEQHSFKWEITKAATATKEGIKTGTCSCGYTKTQTIAATGSSNNSNNNDNSNKNDNSNNKDTSDTTELIKSFVTRLYKVCLDRKPDESGLNYWVNILESGQQSGSQVASGFIFSDEFKAHNYCNSCYVEHLYSAFMGRSSDSDGKAYWINNLETGMTREEVFNGFALSPEFKNICDEYGIVQGEGTDIPEYGTVPKGSCCTDGTVDGVTSFVTRLYNVCLDRDPDATGLSNWTNALWNHERSGSEVASGFIFSQEFTNKNYDDETYVEYLYRAFFDRASDSTGKADWVSKLQNGASREEVFNGFTGSQEFMTLCAKYGIVR